MPSRLGCLSGCVLVLAAGVVGYVFVAVVVWERATSEAAFFELIIFPPLGFVAAAVLCALVIVWTQRNR